MEKTPLILIPALMTDERLFEYQINALSDIADVTVPRLVDHDSISAMASAILEKAPEQFALAGVSLGGYVALEIMRQAPSKVIRLALMNTNARADKPEVMKKRREMMDVAKASEDKFFRAIKKGSKEYFSPKTASTKLETLMGNMAKDVGVKAYMNQQQAVMGRIDSTSFLKDIKCQTAVVCGRDDTRSGPSVMQEIADNIPLAKMIIIEECGHLSPIEQPVAVAAVLRYWLG